MVSKESFGFGAPMTCAAYFSMEFMLNATLLIYSLVVGQCGRRID